MPVTTNTPSSVPHRHHPGRRRAPVARITLAALPLLLLAACGGGGGGDGDGGPVEPPGTGLMVGGTVSGLGEGRSLVLRNYRADNLTVTANGRFVLGRRFSAYEGYQINIASQPDGQRCKVTQNSITAGTTHVTDVAVNCENLPAGTHNLVAQVTGLVPGSPLVLQNNQGDDLRVTIDDQYLFNTPLAGGAAYAVQVQSQPAGQTCTVANASGTVGNTDVRSVQVACGGEPLAFPEGAWVGDRCGPGASNPSSRSHLNISRTGEGRATFSQGRVFFDNNPFCSGSGRVAYDDNLQGTLVVDRQETRGSLTAFWGLQALRSGSQQRVVWARKGPYLCLLPMATATVIYPNPTTEYTTLDAVEKDADEAIRISACHRVSRF